MTIVNGEPWCAQGLWARAMEQLAHKITNDPHPYTPTDRPKNVTTLDEQRRRWPAKRSTKWRKVEPVAIKGDLV
jgi:hypothetical protein